MSFKQIVEKKETIIQKIKHALKKYTLLFLQNSINKFLLT